MAAIYEWPQFDVHYTVILNLNETGTFGFGRCMRSTDCYY